MSRNILLFGALCSLLSTNAYAEDGMTDNDYYQRACKESGSGDYSSALFDYTKAINMNPELWKAYGNRSASRYNTGDYAGALKDINICLEHLQNQSLKDLKKRIEDTINTNAANNQARLRAFNNAMLNAQFGGDMSSPAYGIMQQARMIQAARQAQAMNATKVAAAPQAQPQSASSDLNQRLAATVGGGEGAQASSSGKSAEGAETYFHAGCKKAESLDYAGAIKDFDEAIKLNSKYGEAYANRGSARFNSGDSKGAITDLNTAVQLMPSNQGVKALRDRVSKGH